MRRLIGAKRGVRRDEPVGGKRLEFDGVGAGFARGVDEPARGIDAAVVIDAGLGDDEDIVVLADPALPDPHRGPLLHDRVIGGLGDGA